MEDVKIARKKWFRQTSTVLDAGESQLITPDARRVGVSVATDDPTAFSVAVGILASTLFVASNPSTGGSVFVDIDRYGQVVVGPLVVKNGTAGLQTTFCITEIFLNETESKDL